MNIIGLRSPSITIGGLVYFGRMLDKIRLHLAGKLPTDYQANLGSGFDSSCCEFLRVPYADMVERVKQGGSDEEILAWARTKGGLRSDEETKWWTNHMRKWGWNDAVSERLQLRIKESGIADDGTIRCFFDYIDADEGRLAVKRL
jgi:gluconokinase